MKYEAIEKWLEQFKEYWTSKNFEGIATLFTPDVQYWETPNKLLNGIDAVVEEWRGINEQEEIKIETSLWAMDAYRSTVKWDLQYVKDSKTHLWNGVYLVELTHESMCSYFLQVGEEKV